MNRRLYFLIFSCTLFAVSSTALAETVGQVAKVSGTAYALRDSKKTELKAAMALDRSDTISTAPGATISFVLKDGTIVRLGPSSSVSVEKYIVSESDRSIGLRLIGGKIRANVTKALKQKTSFDIRTSNATAGVRGTDLLVESDSGTGESAVAFTEGRGVVTSTRGKAAVGAGEYVVISKAGELGPTEKITQKFMGRFEEILGVFGEQELELRDKVLGTERDVLDKFGNDTKDDFKGGNGFKRGNDGNIFK